jgi:hypothetical protein
MRKERNEVRIVQQTGVATLHPVALHQEHDLLEGEEADRQRQEQVQFGCVKTCCRGNGVEREAGVFEPAEQTEVEADPEDQPAPCSGAIGRRCQEQDALPAPIVGDDRPHQQQDEACVPPAVKEQPGSEQPAHSPGPPGNAPKQEEPRERNWQEAQDEFR